MTLKKTGIFLLFVLILASCGQYKDVTYFYNIDAQKSDTLFKKVIVQYKVQTADILYVTISGLDEKVNALFNREFSTLSGNPASLMSSMYIIGNPVDQEGQITIPVIGKVLVSGLTVLEIQKKISVLVEKYIPGAITDVRLVSFKISVVGEVRNPGYFTIFNDRANIIEALAMAGDITYNGNKRDVVILRSYESGTKVIPVDLTNKNVLDSEQYYLLPNDVIYIKPLKSTIFRARATDYSILLTAISTTATVILLIYTIGNK
jgi:polysaccharide biosynthesis/export protein